MADYVIDGALLTDIADAIRDKTGGTEPLEVAQLPAGVGDVYAAGVAAGKAESGGDYLRYARTATFPGLGLFDKEEVVLNFDEVYSSSRMFYVAWETPSYANTRVKHLTLNFAQKLTSIAQMFYISDDVVEHITLNMDASQSTSALQIFHGQTALRIVDGVPLDLSSSTNNNNFAYACKALEEIRFVPNTIKASIVFAHSFKLSDATIQSIIDGLADLTGATAQTLTLHADVAARLTDEQMAAITAKNWTLVF